MSDGVGTDTNSPVNGWVDYIADQSGNSNDLWSQSMPGVLDDFTSHTPESGGPTGDYTMTLPAVLPGVPPVIVTGENAAEVARQVAIATAAASDISASSSLISIHDSLLTVPSAAKEVFGETTDPEDLTVTSGLGGVAVIVYTTAATQAMRTVTVRINADGAGAVNIFTYSERLQQRRVL